MSAQVNKVPLVGKLTAGNGHRHWLVVLLISDEQDGQKTRAADRRGTSNGLDRLHHTNKLGPLTFIPVLALLPAQPTAQLRHLILLFNLRIRFVRFCISSSRKLSPCRGKVPTIPPLPVNNPSYHRNCIIVD